MVDLKKYGQEALLAFLLLLSGQVEAWAQAETWAQEQALAQAASSAAPHEYSDGCGISNSTYDQKMDCCMANDTSTNPCTTCANKVKAITAADHDSYITYCPSGSSTTFSTISV